MMDDAIFRDAFHWIIMDFQTYEVRMTRKNNNGCELRNTRRISYMSLFV